MTNAEELLAKLRGEVPAMLAAWPPEERAKVLAKLPSRYREGFLAMIEDHQRTQK